MSRASKARRPAFRRDRDKADALWKTWTGEPPPRIRPYRYHSGVLLTDLRLTAASLAAHRSPDAAGPFMLGAVGAFPVAGRGPGCPPGSR